MSRRLGQLAAILPLFALFGCAQLVRSAKDKTVTVIKDTGTALKEAAEDLTLTPENEYFIGRTVAAKILADYDHDFQDKEAFKRKELAGLTEYVSHVGYLVAARTAEPDTKGAWPMAGYHFIVLNKDEIGAYATPGGFVFVTTGALKAMEDEDELACVLGHEIAHVSERHGATLLKMTKLGSVAGEVASKMVESASGKPAPEVMELFDRIVRFIAELILDKGYGLATEYEADSVGARLAMGAGYDPSALARFLDKLPPPGEKGFLKSHPDPVDRIAKLKKYARPVGAEGPPAARKARFTKAMKRLR